MTTPEPSWHVVGASVTGSAHRKATPPRACDDVCGWRRLPPRTLVIAVADGAGSASCAAAGAAIAVQAALDAVEQQIAPLPLHTAEEWYTLLPTVLTAAQEAIQHQVVAPLTNDDYATTLIVAVVTPDWLAVLHVGDGASVILEADGTIRALTWPHNGVYINETVFITSPQARRFAQVVVCPRGTITGLALLTDGMETLSLDMVNKVASAPFFRPLFDFVTQPLPEAVRTTQFVAFLEAERVNERTDDDKTLVIAVEI